MNRTANSSVGGSYCGRAVNGVSNIGPEEMRQIEAHRARDRPTPWAHLAARYSVNEIDLRNLFSRPANDDARPAKPAKVTAKPRAEITARDARFTTLWNSGQPKTEIAVAMGIHLTTVDKMRDRLGLVKRERNSRPTDWPTADAMYVHEYYIKQKVSAAIVGKHLGRTRGAVIGFASRQGWRRYSLKGREA